MADAFNNASASRPRVDQRTGDDGARELVLVKDDQRYVFTCAPGEEPALLEQLREMARDPEQALTWYDAALLSHQVGVGLSARLRALSDGDG